MVFYSYKGDGTEYHSVQQILSHVASTFVDASIADGDALSATLTADTGYTIDTVVVTMGGEDITATAYTSATGAVAIASVDADVVILATAEETT
jgi:hypothetical protein